MTEEKKVNRINKPVNTTMDDKLRGELQALAETNTMTLSALLRWLGSRAVDSPEKFGLLPIKE